MKKVYEEIYDEIIKHENKKTTETNKKYYKNKGWRSFGIKAPVLGKLLKAYKAEIDMLSCKEAMRLAKILYKNEMEETTLAGNFVLKIKSDCINKTKFNFLDNAINHFTSWSQTDDFCLGVLQPLLLKSPDKCLKIIKKWNNTTNMWKRRASVVVFTRKIGESGKFTKEALELCENLIWDKENLVQKGVGWCLKDAIVGNRKKVYEYIKNLRKRGVNSMIILYAIRNLKSAERKEILRFHK